MIYLISSFPCCLVGESKIPIYPHAKYQISELNDEPILIFSSVGVLPLSINFFDIVFNEGKCNNVCKIAWDDDIFILLFPTAISTANFTSFKYKSYQVSLSVSGEIICNVDGENLLKEKGKDVLFSRYEIRGEFCLIFFEGERNFLIVLKNKSVIFSDYYDEYECVEEDVYFLTRLMDSLNHGKVLHLTKTSEESYLVYLDDFEMQIKDEFVPLVFLDCVRAGNFKYSNQLLSEDIKPKEQQLIAEFFPKFENFVPLKKTAVALIKNNTLAGIVNFEVKDLKIQNIKLI